MIRAAAVAASGIGHVARGGPQATLAALAQLGSVQIDTISVVERAHHHTLWTRNCDYLPEHISALEAEPRRAIEYWSHAAAYIPLAEYRFCLPRMQRIRERGFHWFDADSEAVAFVRERVRAEGPLRAQDFESPTKRKGWWDWKPAKIALEYLFHSGELVAIRRVGFQKVYDLSERALPAELDLSMPTAEEMASHYLDRAETSMGIFAESDIAYMREDGVERIADEVAARLESGRLLALESEGTKLYANPSFLSGLRRASREPQAYVLSPFDPLIIDRKRSSRVFGRVYQLECYLPEKKRSFGYFVLTLLYCDASGDARIVGRLDAKAERKLSLLSIKRLELDPPPEGERLAYAATIAEALARYAAFNGAASMELGRFDSPDGRLERSLRAALARAARTLRG